MKLDSLSYMLVLKWASVIFVISLYLLAVISIILAIIVAYT